CTRYCNGAICYSTFDNW
nr:immunoglobulin heavy chain junction region [Macaca mulatta]MOY21977.1 immunoglobulin heavy chain junction region [Macaca mulatta]MOY22044.1 immunoglobulin heavy chain junction region [Macaca mulatta]MOY22065.1 immunoglobulin heavy chain junction region [Macaca mulatta]MOY22755.1 immunoglobulin heavy chain junction region [Macaca mulatta]